MEESASIILTLLIIFIKKDEYKKIHLFSRTSTNYKNSKINNISEENIIIFSVRLLINHFNLNEIRYDFYQSY